MPSAKEIIGGGLGVQLVVRVREDLAKKKELLDDFKTIPLINWISDNLTNS